MDINMLVFILTQHVLPATGRQGLSFALEDALNILPGAAA
jgi:hypothetical protein